MTAVGATGVGPVGAWPPSPSCGLELERWGRGTARVTVSNLAAVVGVGVAAVAVVVDDRLVVGAVAVAALTALQAVAVRRAPVPATVPGVGQLAAGVVVVAAAAAGVAAA